MIFFFVAAAAPLARALARSHIYLSLPTPDWRGAGGDPDWCRRSNQWALGGTTLGALDGASAVGGL
jgi:hypothetical protein